MKNIEPLKLNTAEQKELITELINEHKKDIMSAMVQEHIFTLEYHKPTNISKRESEDGMAQYQKRIIFLSETIEAIKMYAKSKNI